jgi:predicted Zn-dependent protease
VTGALLAASASYDPWAAVALFRRLAGEESQTRPPTRNPATEAARLIPEALGRYIATHPPADERIEAVGRALRADPGLWVSRRLYVGSGNLKDRRSLSDDPRDDEWIDRQVAP